MTAEDIIQLIEDERETALAIVADLDAYNEKGRYGWTCRGQALQEILDAIKDR